MASLGERLLGHLKVGIPMVSVGGGFQVDDGTNWMMANQMRDGRNTGKIILVCDDEEALEEFTRLATAEGHTVEPAGPQNTILITPHRS